MGTLPDWEDVLSFHWIFLHLIWFWRSFLNLSSLWAGEKNKTNKNKSTHKIWLTSKQAKSKKLFKKKKRTKSLWQKTPLCFKYKYEEKDICIWTPGLSLLTDMTHPMKTMKYTVHTYTLTEKELKKKKTLINFVKIIFLGGFLWCLTSCPRFLTAVLLESWWDSHHKSVLKSASPITNHDPDLVQKSRESKGDRVGLPLDSLHHRNQIFCPNSLNAASIQTRFIDSNSLFHQTQHPQPSWTKPHYFDDWFGFD